MALRDPLSVFWYRYARWARMSDWISALPITEEVLQRAASRLRRQGKLSPEMAHLIHQALYQVDPMQGPGIRGRVSQELHRTRRMLLLDSKPPHRE